MNQKGLKITSVCFVLAMLLSSALTAFAESEEGESLTVNGKAVAEVGDVLTYSLYLSEATEPIVGFEMRLFYDSEHLEYEKSSLNFDNFDVVIYNEDIEGKIPMNCSSLTNTPDFSTKGQFLSADFKVLEGGEADITYFFTELYGENLDRLKSFRFTYDLIRDGEKLVSGAVPPVNTDEDTLENNQGDFINYEDGMGDDNTPDKNHKRIGSAVQKKVVEVTRATDADTDNGGSNKLFFFIGVPLIILAVAGAIVFVVIRGKKERTE